MPRPVKSILDPTFRYTPSTSTDLRKTFARVRREQRKSEELARKANERVLTFRTARKQQQL